jgi:8-oxo-dGTP pyrophosphatase MutT (NUDIX family)
MSVIPEGAGSGSQDVVALPAATLLLLRDAPLEVLMLRRHEKSSFVPNAWVFPGGIVEPVDRELGGDSLLDAMRIAAIRETFEETGVWLGEALDDIETKRRELLAGKLSFRELFTGIDLERLVWTSRWITPLGIPKRFDTWFFLAKVTRDLVATAEENEAAEVAWISPEAALTAHEAGTMQMVLPTVKNLEALIGFPNVEALLEARRDAVIEPIQPVLVVEGTSRRLVIP